MDRFPLDGGLEPIRDDVLLQPQWIISTQENVWNRSSSSGSSENLALSSSRANQEGTHWIDVTLDENNRVTPSGHWQDVRHLKFSSDNLTPYHPGDVLVISPKNQDSDAMEMIRLMGWDDIANQPIHFVQNPNFTAAIASPNPLSESPCSSEIMTLRRLLTDYLDIHAIPRRSFFTMIAHFTDDNFQKSRLLEFTNPEFLDEYYDYTTRPRRSLLEVLQEFDTVKIPWRWAAVAFPWMRGRHFSIASGGQLKTKGSSSTRFELLIAIVKYKTVIRKIRKGVCSRYLESLPSGSNLRVGLRKGGLSLTTQELSRPAIMIAPGTGVAPMRSLIWERLSWIREQESTREHAVSKKAISRGHAAKSVLFFGCRNRDSDFFFRDEWTTIEREMPLTVLTAFSRDQDKKIYVQDLVREQSEQVYQLLHEDQGMLYICGSSGKMPQAVREALLEVFEGTGKMSRGTAEGYLLSMEKEGRYKQETW